MGKKYPKPPDPKETASASTATNVGTAIANAWLGNTDEVTPNGSKYTRTTGWNKWYDPYTGKTIDVPSFTTFQYDSPEQAAIRKQQNAADLNLSTLGNKLSGSLGKQLTGNFRLGNEQTEGRLFELGRKRLDPRFAQQREDLETRLASQGITRGTQLYDTAMRQQGETENDAYNQLMLQGRGQASQELLTEDNQRINQISALLNGGQVSAPNFLGSNMPTIPTTDTAGIINENYNQRLARANAQNSAMSGALGGLFSLGSSFLYSDRELKTDIRRIGIADNGLPIYVYRYKAGGPPMLGFMADEVEGLHPEAVATFNGFKAVDYSRAVQ